MTPPIFGRDVGVGVGVGVVGSDDEDGGIGSWIVCGTGSE